MRLLKIIAAALAAIVVLLIAAAALLVWRFDPNDYKAYVTDWVEQRTGRTLVLEDDLQLSFFPWLAVEAGGVAVGNAEGFGAAEPFATVERLAAEVELLPLLSRRVEIGTIRLDGLRLNLARDADGRGNWEDLAGGGAADGGSAGSPDGAWTEDLDVEAIVIRDGAVNWREDTDRLRYAASGISVETGRIARGEPVDVSLSADVLDVESERTYRVSSRSAVLVGAGTGGADGDEAVALSGFALELAVTERDGADIAGGTLAAGAVRAAADGRVEIADARLESRLPGGVNAAAGWTLAAFDPGAGSLATEGLRTEVAGIAAEWQLAGENLIDRPRAEGSARIASAPLAGALDALDIEPPQGVDPAALGEVSADVAFTFALAPPGGSGGGIDLGPYRLEALTARIDDLRALGVTLDAEAALDGARLTGNVVVPAFTPGEPLTALGRAYAPEALDLGALDRVAASARFDWDAETGRIALDEVRAELLGATLTGEVERTADAGTASYRGTVATTGIAPDRLARLLGDMLPATISPAELGTLALDTRFAYDAGADRATLDQLSLEAFGLAAAGRATVSGVTGSPALTGEARVEAFSPRDLMRRFGQSVPETSDDAALRRAIIATRFDVDSERARFTNLDMTLDDSRITGDFAVTSFEQLGYSFALAIDRVDADRYLPPRAEDVPADAPADAPTAGDIELPAEALHGIRLDGRVEVGELRLAGLDFQDVATGIETGNGRGRLHSAGAKLYGGEFAGSFDVRADGEDRGLTLTGEATGIALEPIIVALTGDANVSGTGDFDLNLSGRGATIIDNVRSASGTVAFALRSGAIEGFNLGRALCAVYNATQRAAAPPERPDVTEYEVIRGSATVTNGVASSPDLLARASFMDVSGAGALTLAEQRLDYELEAKLTGSIGIPGCETMDPLIGESIPLTLRGTVTDPEIRPDFSEIIERRVRDAVEDRLRERVQDRLRDLLQ